MATEMEGYNGFPGLAEEDWDAFVADVAFMPREHPTEEDIEAMARENGLGTGRIRFDAARSAAAEAARDPGHGLEHGADRALGRDDRAPEAPRPVPAGHTRDPRLSGDMEMG